MQSAKKTPLFSKNLQAGARQQLVFTCKSGASFKNVRSKSVIRQKRELRWSMIPFLDAMIKKKSCLYFYDSCYDYVIILKIGSGLVVIYKNMLFADSFWKNESESSNYYDTLDGIRHLQMKKIKDGRILNEMKKIEHLAHSHKIESDFMYFIDVSESQFSCEDIGNLVQQAFDRNLAFDSIKKNLLWPGFSNVSGVFLTDVFVQHIWGQTFDMSMV